MLERYGFVNEDDSDNVWELSPAKFARLYESLYSELRAHQYDGIDGPKSRFSFVASANMRAETGCQEPSCVEQKLEFLAHYASLYCDLVFLPLPLYGSAPRRLPDQRASLAQSIRSLGVLRPVIEGGLVAGPPLRFLQRWELTKQHDSLVRLGVDGLGSRAPRPSTKPLPR
jgi:hypothetical protein